MIKKLLTILIIVGGLALIFSGTANAIVRDTSAPPPERIAEEPPPDRDGDEPPPDRDGCELEDWQVRVIEILAERYEVSTDEITGWYCDGFAFSEIVIAYEIGLISDATVEEILALRAEDYPWYEILQEIGLIDGDDPQPPPGRDGDGYLNPYCLGGEASDAMLERLAEFYGMTKEEVSKWICGPFDHWNYGQYVGAINVNGVFLEEVTGVPEEGLDWEQVQDIMDQYGVPPIPNPGDIPPDIPIDEILEKLKNLPFPIWQP